MNINKLAASLAPLILMLCISLSAQAQTCSCASVPLLNSLDASSANEGKWYFGTSVTHHEINDLYAGTNEVKDETDRSRQSDSLLVSVDYGIDERWSVSTLVGFIKQERDVGTSSDSFTSTSGLGDGLIIVKYTPKRINLFSKWEYALGLGARIPLGKDDATNNGIILAEDMHPSTGAYGLIGWGYVAKALDQAGQKKIFISSNFSVNGENSRNYSFSDELNISFGGSYFMQENWGFNALLHYRITGEDERNGSSIPNTGGKWLDFEPSVQYRFNDKSAVKLTLTTPLYRDLRGALQFTSSGSASVGYNYAF